MSNAHQTKAQYSGVEWTRAKVAVGNVVAPALQPEPASRLKSATRDVNFLRSDSRCQQYVSVLSNVIPRNVGSEKKVQGFVVKVGFFLTFTSLVAEMEDYQHCFCSAVLQLTSLEVFIYGCHAFGQHPFHCLSISISMHHC